MSIPKFQEVMLPLLKLVKEKGEIALKDAYLIIADQFNLTEEEMTRMLPSGVRNYIYDRVIWANTYMKQAGLLQSPRRGVTAITEEGIKVLNENPDEINVNFLKRYLSFIDFISRKSDKKGKTETEVTTDQATEMTPDEAFQYGYEKINETLANDLLSLIMDKDAMFFEQLVVELLVKMGYGGSIKEAGSVIGRSGDEGIDGIIKEDKLD